MKGGVNMYKGCFNPYFIGLPILINSKLFSYFENEKVSILILLDYLFLLCLQLLYWYSRQGFNPYFIGLPILINFGTETGKFDGGCFNPYFIGLPILITMYIVPALGSGRFQSLFYWITYSY